MEGRADKAQKLARVLRRVGVDAATAGSWIPEQWAVAAAMAGLKVPSERTQGMVVGLLTPGPTLRRTQGE